ncbi:hypothetical protein POTOM_059019 [Populus tomentosa]|uniref:Uncharacterized protein n=1 Tax=Populus tomentosa TaxID=118781 RepID=A0A8X8C1Q5_POPTO|nr:hypothetical protein POTOM_059019 [Populus tomentosa]
MKEIPNLSKDFDTCISSAACIKEVVVLSNVETACYESNSCCSSKMMRGGQRQFSIDLGSNKRGHFLEITNDSYSREGHLTDENLKKRFSAEISETQIWADLSVGGCQQADGQVFGSQQLHLTALVSCLCIL